MNTTRSKPSQWCPCLLPRPLSRHVAAQCYPNEGQRPDRTAIEPCVMRRSRSTCAADPAGTNSQTETFCCSLGAT